ncbi:hypothetical protein D3C71_2029600 [compost metagenome]
MPSVGWHKPTFALIWLYHPMANRPKPAVLKSVFSVDELNPPTAYTPDESPLHGADEWLQLDH